MAAARLKLYGRDGERGSGWGNMAAGRRRRIRGQDGELGHTNRLI